MTSGDPRKQEHPDERHSSLPDPVQQMIAAFPPSTSLVTTEIRAEAVPFPFVGGKAIDLTLVSGPYSVHAHFHPTDADAICDAIQQAKAEAVTDIVKATMDDVAKVNGNGH